jgi:DNA polymerase-4
VAADSSRYTYTSSAIAEMLERYSNRLERASIDEFYLDLTAEGVARAAAIAAEIRARIKKEFSITGSIGIAPAKIVAKMAAKSCKPDGLRVLAPDQVRDFLDRLSVQKVPGIGPHLTSYLNELSIFTLGELSAAPVEWLIQRFGKTGAWMSQVSRGIDPEEVGSIYDPDAPPKSIGHSYTLERELCRRQDIEGWIRMLSEMVAFRLRKEGVEASTAHLYLRGRFYFLSREKKFRSASSDPEVIYERSLNIMRSFGLKTFSVKALGVSASGLAQTEPACLFTEDKRRQELLKAVDRINERFGEWAICPAVIKDIKR